ncbi:hypothetical protein C8J57DRAFT_1680088 [Mycena rebaudengoi]|nr:hypothetical protein C8J57DRAFT_1680088 [Mycena rebaudengoi]
MLCCVYCQKRNRDVMTGTVALVAVERVDVLLGFGESSREEEQETRNYGGTRSELIRNSYYQKVGDMGGLSRPYRPPRPRGPRPDVLWPPASYSSFFSAAAYHAYTPSLSPSLRRRPPVKHIHKTDAWGDGTHSQARRGGAPAVMGHGIPKPAPVRRYLDRRVAQDDVRWRWAWNHAVRERGPRLPHICTVLAEAELRYVVEAAPRENTPRLPDRNTLRLRTARATNALVYLPRAQRGASCALIWTPAHTFLTQGTVGAWLDTRAVQHEGKKIHIPSAHITFIYRNKISIFTAFWIALAATSLAHFSGKYDLYLLTPQYQLILSALFHLTSF